MLGSLGVDVDLDPGNDDLLARVTGVDVFGPPLSEGDSAGGNIVDLGFSSGASGVATSSMKMSSFPWPIILTIS